jgi:hypothetical protein
MLPKTPPPLELKLGQGFVEEPKPLLKITKLSFKIEFVENKKNPPLYM